MGATSRAERAGMEAGEPAATCRSRAGALARHRRSRPTKCRPRSTSCRSSRSRRRCADGETRITGAAELRREGERPPGGARAAADARRRVRRAADGLVIEGGAARRLRGGRIDAYGDHRIAMAFAVVGLCARRRGRDRRPGVRRGVVPGLLRAARPARGDGGGGVMRRLVVAIDGPAGAGKSTVSRALAERLGYAYVDTGAMYRVVGVLAHERGIDARRRRGAGGVCATRLRFELRDGGRGHGGRRTRPLAGHPHARRPASWRRGSRRGRWCASGWWRCSGDWAPAAAW